MSVKGLIGLSNFTIAQRNTDDYSVVEDTIVSIPGIVDAKIETEGISQTFYSDDIASVNYSTGFSSGKLTATLLGLSLEEYSAITGQIVEKGILIDNANVVSPDLTVAFKSMKTDGTYRYVCLPLVKGVVGGQEFKTREDGVEIANIEVVFEILVLPNGNWKITADEGNIELPADFLSTFFEKFPTEAPKGAPTKTTK